MADVTDCAQLTARLRLLGSVCKHVGQTLDLVVTCEELVREVVPGLADVAVVDVVDAVARGEDPPPSPLARGVPLRRIAFGRSGGEEQLGAHPVGDVRALAATTPYAQTLTRRPPSPPRPSSASW
ncbi:MULTISPECIES: hypothetical protein [unclassified Streptomyces]|uniref:hypothetical protein n=1 Tax=unclassified Streptomyces TaxID=2593676 RepID=UPI004042A07C